VKQTRKQMQNVNLSLYPNPSNGEFTAHFSMEKGGLANFRVFNNQGQVVRNSDSRIGKGDLNMALNFSDLRPGIYFLQMTCGTQSGTQRFVIK
jgi:hypothetical protein